MTDEPTPQDIAALANAVTGPRKPRIALMGEFSAGKSTLANLMIGADPLPVQVIATQLPPVWISHGTGPARIVGLDGQQAPCDFAALQGISADDTAFIRIQCEEEILKMCDIIDMPGISDPNMSSDVWERILPLADGVIWCSPATQAWRQSEASVWDMVPEQVRQHSILLLTRGDMLVSETDRQKVLRRVRSETDDLFLNTLMVSLTQARDAGDDEQLWDESGVEPFVREFLNVISQLSDHLLDGVPPDALPARTSAPPVAPVARDDIPSDATDVATRVVPRRPVVKSPPARARPRTASANEPGQTP